MLLQTKRELSYIYIYVRLFQLRQEKCELEVTLEKEQEYQVNKLMRRIQKLQADVVSKQSTLEQVSSVSVCIDSVCACDSVYLCVWLDKVCVS